jgi:hypothetical protein
MNGIMDEADRMAGRAAAEARSADGVTTGRRESQRARLRLTATLQATTREYPVMLRDLSCTGAKVEGDEVPPAGRTVALKRGEIDLLADVVWQRGRFCGLHFFDSLQYEQVLHLAALPPEEQTTPSVQHYVAPTDRDDRLTAEEWARAKLRASQMRR